MGCHISSNEKQKTHRHTPDKVIRLHWLKEEPRLVELALLKGDAR